MPNHTAKAPTPALSVLQFTDTHLFSDSDGKLLGITTLDSFRRTLRLARSRHWPPDLILATGDLVHDGSPVGYATLHRELATLARPVYCLPGNHDHGKQLLESLNGAPVRAVDHATHGSWGFAFVDTNLADSNGGHLSEDALQRLEASLSALGDRHVMVCLHHQPVPVGSRWLDTMQVDNAQDLFDLLERFPNVRSLLWGHVHQEFDRQLNGMRLLACHSTCIQFAPGSEDFALDDRLPGYRWLRLHADGGIDTGVERLTELPGGPDLGSRGY
jgi:Icc protein